MKPRYEQQCKKIFKNPHEILKYENFIEKDATDNF